MGYLRNSMNLLVGRHWTQKKARVAAGPPHIVQVAALTRAMASRASAAKVAASPKPRAASIAPCTDDMKALASSAAALQAQLPAPHPFQGEGQPATRSSKCPRTSSAISGGIIGASAASIAQMQNEDVPCNTAGPVLHIRVEFLQRVVELAIQQRQALARLGPVQLNYRAHQVRLAGEVVMDAGLADVHPRRHVGVAEAVVATGSSSARAWARISWALGESDSSCSQSTSW